MTPETAVAVAAALLRKTGARIAEVPEAFTIVRLLEPAPPLVLSRRVVGDVAICPRWRLTLDRPVPLRGTASGQVVRTQTVYVTRGEGGCRGAPLLQVPTPTQPATVPFMYDASRPSLGSGYIASRTAEFRWTELRVLEPLWFEEARVSP